MAASGLAPVVGRSLLALVALAGEACTATPPAPPGPGAGEIPLVDAHSQINEAVDPARVIALMDQAGVRYTILSTNGRMTPAELVAVATKHPGRIVPAMSPVRSKRQGLEAFAPGFLERQAQLGGFGALAEVLIYHAQKGDRAPPVAADLDAPPVAALLRHVGRQGWPLVLHIEFRAAGPRRAELMAKLETLLSRHPEQPVALIHMAQLDPAGVRTLIAAHGNVYFITSHANPIHGARSRGQQPWTNMFASPGPGLAQEWRELLVRHPDRFVLGFDSVYAEDWGELYLSQVALWRRALVELPHEVAHAVAHGNAERLWRLPPLTAGGLAPPPPAATPGPAAPPPDLAGGKRYGMEVRDAIAAFQRGEGRQALAFYTREAAERERSGPRIEAARAHAAVLFAGYRLGLYQPAIRAGLRALELLQQEPPEEEVLWRQLPVYNHVGATRLDSVPQLLVAHGGVAAAHAGLGRHQEALAEFQRASTLLEDVRSQLQEAGLRSGFLEDKQAIYQGAVRSALALGKPDVAFGYAERGRSRALLDLLGSQTTLSKARTRGLVEEELRLRVRLSEAQASAGELEDEEGPGPGPQGVDAAREAYQAFLDRVRKESLEQASLMTVEPVTLADVQALLPEGTTLLEYLVMPEEALLWVVDRTRVEVVRLPVSRRDLVDQVRALRRAIAERAVLGEVQARARRLHDRLLLAARPHVRGERLLVVPHDVLHYLPFGALRGPEGRWLIEDHTLATVPGASVLRYLQGKGAAAGEGALAVGNPDLGPGLELRYAEREARAVGARFPGSRVLLRQEATRRQVRALSGQAGLLHFATHGELSELDPLASALLLTPEAGDDGRLQVREVFGLDLHARLVVLSACETGLGALSRGDELVGLQRAFLYAGAPAVVTTLWKVDDRASYLVMEEFYAAVGAAGPAGALRAAQRAVLRTHPHPFSWAAFGLAGTPW